MAEHAHDQYGKLVLRSAAGAMLKDWGPPVEVDFGTASRGRIDGVVGDIAVEIESRTSKQVRGAVLDLLLHPAQKKLLILLPVHQSNVALCADQCRYALARFIDGDRFRVVVVEGHGYDQRLEVDSALVKAALIELGMGAAL